MTRRSDVDRVQVLRAGVAAVLVVAALTVACSAWFTDPATFLAADIIDNANALRRSAETERSFVHRPASSPNACSNTYRVTLSGGEGAAAIGIGCDGRPPGVFSWTTNQISRVVSVPSELSVAKKASEPLRVTLRRNGTVIDVVRLD